MHIALFLSDLFNPNFDVPEALNVQMNEVKKIELFLPGVLSKSKSNELHQEKMGFFFS